MTVPLAVVGATWRTAPTRIRSRLAALSLGTEPVALLRQGGYVAGAVCVSTCSRTEFVLSSPHPEWAANLLTGVLHTRVPELEPKHLHVRAGAGAGHYLLRVAAGLDSVAEGEAAVGRQVLQAFEKARAQGLTDSHLRKVWKHIERLVHCRREKVHASESRGVQALVRESLKEAGAKKVAVLGRGEFGRAMDRSLRGVRGFEVTTFSRGTSAELFEHMTGLDALVVCTGASHAWLNLPPRQTPGLCIDVGSPPQVAHGPGWTVVGLDELLARPEFKLSDAERHHLEQLILESANRLVAALTGEGNHHILAAIDAERTTFLREQLPALLEGLPRAQKEKVRQAVGAFTHTLLRRARERTP
jgi:glutamyl-tRNA reductase